jgi:hypothetical protein
VAWSGLSRSTAQRASTVAYGVTLVVMLLSLRRLPSDSSGTRRDRHQVDRARLRKRRDDPDAIAMLRPGPVA